MSGPDGEPAGGAGSGAPRAVVFGCSGPALTAEEAAFFRDADPLGFILFARNVETPDQVRALVDGLRDSVGRTDAPVLIDQEGGRVQRLRPPHWPERPPMRPFGELAGRDLAKSLEAVRLNARLIADDLGALGIDVDCAPVADVPVAGAHDIIGDRAFSDVPAIVAMLARAFCDGLTEGGVTPVIKHIPGHGRATADSHVELPRVTVSRETLEASDFGPFAVLRDIPAAMTAHVVYEAIDGDNPGSASPALIGEVIRGDLGFEGLLFSDDLCMRALSGSMAERLAAVLGAGCDVALHCDGDLAAMREIASACPPLTAAAQGRLSAFVREPSDPDGFDRAAVAARLARLLG